MAGSSRMPNATPRYEWTPTSATNKKESTRRTIKARPNAASSASASVAKMIHDDQGVVWNVRTASLGCAAVLMYRSQASWVCHASHQRVFKFSEDHVVTERTQRLTARFGAQACAEVTIRRELADCVRQLSRVPRLGKNAARGDKASHFALRFHSCD